MRRFEVIIDERIPILVNAASIGISENGQVIFYNQKNFICGVAPIRAVVREIF
jgi:hypothetical protein